MDRVKLNRVITIIALLTLGILLINEGFVQAKRIKSRQPGTVKVMVNIDKDLLQSEKFVENATNMRVVLFRGRKSYTEDIKFLPYNKEQFCELKVPGGDYTLQVIVYKAANRSEGIILALGNTEISIKSKIQTEEIVDIKRVNYIINRPLEPVVIGSTYKLKLDSDLEGFRITNTYLKIDDQEFTQETTLYTPEHRVNKIKIPSKDNEIALEATDVSPTKRKYIQFYQQLSPLYKAVEGSSSLVLFFPCFTLEDQLKYIEFTER